MVTQASTLTSAIEDARKAKVAQGKIDEANACLEKLEGQGKAAEVGRSVSNAQSHSHSGVLDCRSTLVCLGKRKATATDAHSNGVKSAPTAAHVDKFSVRAPLLLHRCAGTHVCPAEFCGCAMRWAVACTRSRYMLYAVCCLLSR